MHLSEGMDGVELLVEVGAVAVKVSAVVPEDDISDDPLDIRPDGFVVFPEISLLKLDAGCILCKREKRGEEQEYEEEMPEIDHMLDKMQRYKITDVDDGQPGERKLHSFINRSVLFSQENPIFDDSLTTLSLLQDETKNRPFAQL
jgi:hypothetical protein